MDGGAGGGGGGRKATCTIIAGGGGRVGGPRREALLSALLRGASIHLPPAARAGGQAGAAINRGRMPARTTESFGVTWKSTIASERERRRKISEGMGILFILFFVSVQTVNILMMSKNFKVRVSLSSDCSCADYHVGTFSSFHQISSDVF